MSQDYLAGASGISSGAVNYFEVDPSSGAFMRVFAPLVTLDHYELVVRLNNEDIALTSAYDLLQLRVGDTFLRGFAYKKEGEDVGQIYLLPEHGTFEPADAEVVGPGVTKEDQLDQLAADPDVVKIRARLEQSRENTKAAMASTVKMLQDQGVVMQQLKADATPEAFLAALKGASNSPATAAAPPESLTQVNVISKSKKGRVVLPVRSPKTKATNGTSKKPSRQEKKKHDQHLMQLFPG
jgi:hypothetical protein